MEAIEQQFIKLVDSNPRGRRLAEAVVLLAAIENQGLEIAHCHAQLERLAEQARAAIPATDDAQARATHLCQFLREEQQFRGDDSDYYAPANSHINSVLERKLGIPISLAFIYLHVGNALGWRLNGIGFPGHFLVSISGEPPSLIDPFAGVPLDESDCVALVQRVQGSEAVLKAEYLQPLSGKMMLQRMLTNLKENYMQQGSWQDALRTLNLLLAVDDSALRLRYERALALERLECYAAAGDDLQHIARSMPRDSQPAALHKKIKQMEARSDHKLH